MSEERRKLDKALARRALAKKQEKEERHQLLLLSRRLKALDEAQSIAQDVAQKIQTQAHARIAQIVSECLAIFENPYKMQINFIRSRGKTEARLSFIRDGMEVDPLSASGGGVVDVAAFALRLACLILSRPPKRRILILDEPLKMLSSGYHVNVRQLLNQMAKKLGVQIIMVSHNPKLACGKIIEVE